MICLNEMRCVGRLFRSAVSVTVQLFYARAKMSVHALGRLTADISLCTRIELTSGKTAIEIKAREKSQIAPWLR